MNKEDKIKIKNIVEECLKNKKVIFMTLKSVTCQFRDVAEMDIIRILDEYANEEILINGNMGNCKECNAYTKSYEKVVVNPLTSCEKCGSDAGFKYERGYWINRCCNT